MEIYIDHIKKILSKFHNYGFNFDKKIKIFDYEERNDIEVPLNDYIWFFIQSIRYSIVKMEFTDFVYLYIKNTSKNKLCNDINLHDIDINFGKDKIRMRIFFKHDSFKNIFNNENGKNDELTYSKIITDFTESMLKKLYNNRENKFVTTFIGSTLDYEKPHSIILFFSKDGDDLELYKYDPNGIVSEYHKKINIFLDHLKKNIKNINSSKKYFSGRIKIISQEETRDVSLQNLLEINTNYGYCVIFTSFFLYCVATFLCHNPSENIKTTVEKLNLSFFIIFYEIKQKKFYENIVSFANIIKDEFIISNQKKDNYEEIMRKINDRIINMYKQFSKNEKKNVIDFEKDELNGEIFYQTNKNKRNYDEELNLLDWDNVKEKRENEKCKIDDECISKLCVKNKCTKPNDNDKLDFLTRLEWDEIREENKEIKKIENFCGEKTLENFDLLKNSTQEFFSLSADYTIEHDEKKIYFAKMIKKFFKKNIIDYEEKYLFFKKNLNPAEKEIYKLEIYGKNKYFIEQNLRNCKLFYSKNIFSDISDKLYNLLDSQIKWKKSENGYLTYDEYDEEKWPNNLKNIRDCLEKIVQYVKPGFPKILNSVLCSKYLNCDENKLDLNHFKLDKNSFVVSVFLGNEREIFFLDEKISEKIILKSGSVIIMDNNCEKKYNNYIKNTNQNNTPTISLIFKSID